MPPTLAPTTADPQATTTGPPPVPQNKSAPTTQQAAGNQAMQAAAPVPDAISGASPLPGAPDAEAKKSEFPVTILPTDADLFVVPANATRTEIAQRLFGDTTRENAFTFVITAGVPAIDNQPGRAVRVTAFSSLIDEAQVAMRSALDTALSKDVEFVIGILCQRFIPPGDEDRLAEATLRWSNRSDILDGKGVDYFKDFLNRLESRTLTVDHIFWSTTKTALEWLVIEAESTREQVEKAITLRSDKDVGYEPTEGPGEFPRESVIGRFYYSGGGSLQIIVVEKIAEAETLESALTITRNSDFTGLRAVVPGLDSTDPHKTVFRGYSLIAPTVNDPLVPHAEDDPGGHYYWYYPGTVMIALEGFEKNFAKGGEDELYQRRAILSHAIEDASFDRLDHLLGLDYDVLSTATVDERVQMITYALRDGSKPGPASALIARVITSTPPGDRATLEASLRGSDLLDAIIKIPDPAITSALGPTTSEEEEQALDKLEGGEDVFKLYQDWRDSFNPRTLKFDEKITAELDAKVKELGFASIQEFGEAISGFEDTFERFALQTAFQMLDQNEALAKGEFARYAGDPSGSGIADLRKDLGPLRKQVLDRNSAIQGRDAAEERVAALRPAGGVTPEYEQAAEEKLEWDKKAEKEIAATQDMVTAMQARFPVLADPSLDVTALIGADDATLQTLFLGTARNRLTDIEKARWVLKRDPSEVWKLEGVIARARTMMGVTDGSVFDLMLREKQKREQHESIFKAIFIGALSLGLAVFGGPAGMAAAAVISGYTAVTHIQEYLIQQTMTGTAFDRAQALSADEPSLFWLALDIVGAVFDAGAAMKAMSALKPLVKETIAITDAVRQAEKLKEIETVAKSVDTAEHLEGTAQQTAKSADPIAPKAQAAKPVDAPAAPHVEPHQSPAPPGAKNATGAAEATKKADDLAAKVVADVKQRIKGEAALASLGEDGKALVALCKGDAAAAGGLARIEAGARAGIVAALQDSPDAARLLGNLAVQSDAVAHSAEQLFKAFVTEGGRADQFAAILKKYFVVSGPRGLRKANMFRALGEAGLEDADYARLAEEMKGLTAPGNVQTTFSKKAISAIADKLPPGSQGIQKLTEMSKFMETSAKGSVFEQWCKKYIFVGMERFSEHTAELPGKYTRELLLSDGFIKDGAELTVVELKNYVDTLPTFAKNTAEGKQLANYAEMIESGVKGPGNVPFGKVNYVFSTEEAAKKASQNIEAVLGDKAIIQFIDPATGARVLLK